MYTAHNGRFIQRRTNYLCPGGGEVGTVSPNSYMRAMVDSRCYFVQLFRLSSLPTIAIVQGIFTIFHLPFFQFIRGGVADKYSRNNVPRKNYRRLRDIVTYIIFLETRRRNQQNAKYISQKSLHLRAWHTHLIFPKACLSRRPQVATRREKFNRGTILVRLNVTAARTRYRRDIQGGEERNRAKHGGWRERGRREGWISAGSPDFPSDCLAKSRGVSSGHSSATWRDLKSRGGLASIRAAPTRLSSKGGEETWARLVHFFTTDPPCVSLRAFPRVSFPRHPPVTRNRPLLRPPSLSLVPSPTIGLASGR